MIETFITRLEIPESCALNKRVFKKLFEENTRLDITDKKALKDDVQEIRWLYTLKPSTINIPRYADELRDYPEVAILLVTLSTPIRFKRVAAFIQRAIPYPLMLIFSYEDSIALSLADKRINQADNTKLVVEANFETDWIDLEKPTAHQLQFMDDLSIKRLSFLNFYAFYQDICQRVIALNCANLTGRYNLKAGDGAGQQTRVEMLRELQKLEQAQVELRNKLKKETQLGRQVELNSQIRKLGEQMEAMKQRL